MPVACEKCGSQLESFGPLWLGKLYEKNILKKMLSHLKDDKARKKVELMYKELDVPLFYSVPMLTKHLGLPSVSNYAVMEKLSKSGSTVTGTQFDQNAFKTDADSAKVLKIVKSLV